MDILRKEGENMKIIRYKKHNNSLHIGGMHNKLSIFFYEKLGRLQIGKHTFHFGKW